MVSDLLGKWLAHYDPIHRGWTRAGVANGVTATCGFCFPRILGGYHLRRRVGGTPGADDAIVGTAGHDATTIRTFPWVRQEAGVTYVYRLFPVGGGGVENHTDMRITLTGLRVDGRWRGAWPNSPADLRVDAMAGGRFRLRWTYPPEGEQATPSEFRVYRGEGGRSVDFGAVVATLPHHAGQFHHEYVSEAFAHGEQVRWAVRAATASAEEANDATVCGWAMARPPAARPVVVISCVETRG